MPCGPWVLHLKLESTVARLVSGATQPVALRLLEGIAGFLYDGDGDGVQVHTPSAVAAVRSTQWAMRIEDDASAVFAREGVVFVRGDEATVHLAPGDGVDVSANGDVGSVVRWGKARIDLFARLLGPGW
jgi:ferric-dicitrate binding protein FerR (iron transport regulator)